MKYRSCECLNGRWTSVEARALLMKSPCPGRSPTGNRACLRCQPASSLDLPTLAVECLLY
eukprot:15473658-Alexandrium_andersonii.AAC.2